MTLKNAWIEILYKSATSTKKIRSILTPFGALFFAFFLAVFIFMAIQMDDVFNISWILASRWNIIISLILLIAGIALTGWSVYHFLKVKGTPVPLNPPPELVTTGPYRYARNPMLGGVFLVMFGIGFLIQSFSLVLVFTPLFIVVNLLELKYIEEPELEKRLGTTYMEYKKNTPMFFPGVKNILGEKYKQ